MEAGKDSSQEANGFTRRGDGDKPPISPLGGPHGCFTTFLLCVQVRSWKNT